MKKYLFKKNLSNLDDAETLSALLAICPEDDLRLQKDSILTEKKIPKDCCVKLLIS